MIDRFFVKSQTFNCLFRITLYIYMRFEVREYTIKTLWKCSWTFIWTVTIYRWSRTRVQEQVQAWVVCHRGAWVPRRCIMCSVYWAQPRAETPICLESWVKNAWGLHCP